MEPLPVELFLEVLSFLPGKTVFIIRRVSPRWNKIISESNLLWQKLLSRDFQTADKDDNEGSWMQAYKNRAR